ncbi:cytosolic endo-beta-N-acetylglucosaminidase isoform X2 [Zootermopsis nevadensis]|nr:cytosolic endo-beta-N-acetylglucosaminidase isoform X2 [Zootermopsis nevadensis]XP_021931967.1 cytosolic endo-beta-N-acetylglucosaminidase isoform X2 [Zootermopsis nevadensis]
MRHAEYRFFHWAGIDTFVYFSHQLVTIPPPVWINSAHLHGTKVLGTLITEWDDGKKVWGEILESDGTVEDFVNDLVAICCHFGFDGYLLNVENNIPPEYVTRLELFVKLIHSRLHSKIPYAEVIWYDSVTKEGKLEWQNELNNLNRPFFNNCDGIFLNYTWKEDNLKKSVENAGARHLDVYVGVDVFGRNCYGGGGFNSCQAVELARKYNLSLALFAPSWVHEYLGSSHFVHLEYAFWQKLWPYLYIHGPARLPFSTTFCQGYGEKLYRNGQVVSDAPWYNLSKQQYQPTVPSCLSDSFVEPILKAGAGCVDAEVLPLITTGCVQHCSQDAFTGGGCLQISRSCSKQKSQRIFVCRFDCEGQILVSLATKTTDKRNPTLNLLLLTEDSEGVCRTLSLVGEETGGGCGDRKCVFPLEQKEVEQLKYCLQEEVFDDVSPSVGSGWKLSHYVLHLRETVVEIAVESCGSHDSVLLGLLRILPLTS